MLRSGELSCRGEASHALPHAEFFRRATCPERCQRLGKARPYKKQRTLFSFALTAHQELPP